MEFTLEETFDAPAATIYKTWLSSEGHSKMTGAEAACSDFHGGDFMAWDGYISGKNVVLVPGKFIRQTWRTTQFKKGQPDSILEIEFTEEDGPKTRLTLRHSRLGAGDGHYKKGWVDHYFKPMREFFNAGSSN